ncbi:amidohydrolase [Candidatus Palauibacter sp.]|uniref:amidohydrolase n=1 Tax=Candidatus Palauibacter sp. TaxID=3101350 RepID=UPI003B515A3E
MRKAAAAFAFTLGFAITACAPEPNPGADPVDTIFFGDNIVTMDPLQPTVEAVAVRGETIVAAGARDEVMALEGPSTRMVELGENALLPGFIDAHGHFLGAGRDQTSLLLHPPPVGDVENIDDIVRKVRAWIDEHDIPPGEPVTGRGYDDSLLEEGRHPTREDLDRASTEHPIVLTHVSGHLTTTNSAALAASDITADTPDPPGGHVRRIEGSMEPNGVLEETASGLLAIERSPAPSRDELDDLIRRSIDVYLSHGTTTIQDGGTGPAQAERFRAAADREPFKADIAAFVRNRAAPNAVPDVSYAREYRNGFRVAGVKLMLDGSPQGRTAWVTIPYEERPPNTPPDYVAYGVMDPGEYKAQADQLIKAGIPIIVHANGDAAMDLMMDGVDEAVADMDPMPDHRSVIIHAQLMRADQLDRAAELNVVPSFFAAHAFFWGDWHRRSFGEERGNNISPVGWALERGVDFTVHNDAPVVPPHIMRLVSITVNRKTRSGHILGPDQRPTVMQALHAVTLGGAYQYFEEDTKGSITIGKQADLVILGENPLTANPENLEFIPILETFSRGRSVFSR